MNPRPDAVRGLRRVLVLLLSCAAGGVDAASYIGLGHVFAANMTGNTVHLGMAVGQASSVGVVRAGAALIGFLVGAVLSAAIVERDDSPAAWPRVVTLSLLFELLLLVATVAIWNADGAGRDGVAAGLLGALGVAMGIQSVAIRRLRIPGVASTYLTGTLTALAAGLVRRLLVTRKPAPEAPTHGAALLVSVWTIYATGAAVTTFLSPRGGPRSLVLPIAFITIVLVVAEFGAMRPSVALT